MELQKITYELRIDSDPGAMIALFLNMVFIFVVLKSIDRIEKILGPGLIYVLRKFFGIILLAIAVKLFTSNIGHLIG